VARGDLRSARKRLDTLAGFANDGLMIPEQVWERTGKGTGSATPLAWSMAEFIRLAMKIERRHVDVHAEAQRRNDDRGSAAPPREQSC
jgi:GH15 family glucan-1,4-alpha-glucosidase